MASEKKPAATLLVEPRATLGERISWITGQVAQIEATGHNRFSKAAMSVEDVEDALRPLFSEADVVALWSCIGFETAPDKEAAWLLKFHVTIYAAENPSDKIEAEWFDVGSSPTAAQSFAVKGFYRRLFHLASADDEEKKAPAPPLPPPPVKLADPASIPGDLSYLAETLPTPWAPNYLAQEIARLKEETVRRRLRLAHQNACGNDCAHLTFAESAQGWLDISVSRWRKDEHCSDRPRSSEVPQGNAP